MHILHKGRMPRRRSLPMLISNRGRVSDKTRFRYFPIPKESGRRKIGLTNPITKRMIPLFVHRVVHILFNDPGLVNFKPCDTVDHINTDCLCNEDHNLRWLNKSGQRKNQTNQRLQTLAPYRYRLSNPDPDKHDVDYSERSDVANFLGIETEMVPMVEIKKGSFEHCGWTVWTLDQFPRIEGEQWKKIDGCDGWISSLGRMHRLIENGYRTYYPRINVRGCCETHILNKRHQVHRLVAYAFNLSQLNGQIEVDHIDRNPGNNSVENLRWVTPKENCANRSKKRPKQVRKIDAKETTSSEWIHYSGGIPELVAAHGVCSTKASAVLNPNTKQRSAPGKNGVRYHVRLANDPTQDDLPGEEWKEIVVEDWDVGGKYYCIGEDKSEDSDESDAESDSD